MMFLWCRCHWQWYHIFFNHYCIHLQNTTITTHHHCQCHHPHLLILTMPPPNVTSISTRIKIHFHCHSNYKYMAVNQLFLLSPALCLCYFIQHINDNISLRISRKYMLYNGQGTRRTKRRNVITKCSTLLFHQKFLKLKPSSFIHSSIKHP